MESRKSQRRNKKVNDPTARTPPEIPSDLQQLTPTAEALGDSEIHFENVLLKISVSKTIPVNPLSLKDAF
jgi:hypothetical protein